MSARAVASTWKGKAAKQAQSQQSSPDCLRWEITWTISLYSGMPSASGFTGSLKKDSAISCCITFLRTCGRQSLKTHSLGLESYRCDWRPRNEDFEDSGALLLPSKSNQQLSAPLKAAVCLCCCPSCPTAKASYMGVSWCSLSLSISSSVLIEPQDHQCGSVLRHHSTATAWCCPEFMCSSHAFSAEALHYSDEACCR